MTDARLYSLTEILAAAHEIRPEVTRSTVRGWLGSWYALSNLTHARANRGNARVHTAAALEAVVARASRPMMGSELPSAPAGWRTVRQIRAVTGWAQDRFRSLVVGVPSATYGSHEGGSIRARTFYDTSAIPGYQEAVDRLAAIRAARPAPSSSEPRRPRRAVPPPANKESPAEFTGTWVKGAHGVLRPKPDP